jgi:hypothetical protein
MGDTSFNTTVIRTVPVRQTEQAKTAASVHGGHGQQGTQTSGSQVLNNTGLGQFQPMETPLGQQPLPQQGVPLGKTSSQPSSTPSKLSLHQLGLDQLYKADLRTNPYSFRTVEEADQEKIRIVAEINRVRNDRSADSTTLFDKLDKLDEIDEWCNLNIGALKYGVDIKGKSLEDAKVIHQRASLKALGFSSERIEEIVRVTVEEDRKTNHQ